MDMNKYQGEEHDKFDIRRMIQKPDLSNYAFGKIPPQARDLEEAVLGAIMLESDVMLEVSGMLRPESFYVTANQLIYQACLNLFNKQGQIDILTVTNELRRMDKLEEVGGAFHITELTDRIASAAHTQEHARIISQKELLRDYIKIGSEALKMAYDDTTDPFELGEILEKGLMEAIGKHVSGNIHSMVETTKIALETIEKAYNSDGTITGVPSGFSKLDEKTGGWQPTDLIIIGARPSMGKTGFVLQCARNAAYVWNIPVAIFSLEMSAVQLVNRMIGSEASVSSHSSRTGRITEGEFKRITEVSGEVAEFPIFIDDTPALDILSLKSKARKLVRESGIKLLIVDYIQLCTVHYHVKDPIGEISRQLKALAKELNIPIIAVSQLSRAVETRGGDKRPQLSDLRESGSIEQDADVVGFIFRADYYEKDPTDEYGNDLKNLTEVLIRKHRNGPLAEVLLKFMRDTLRMYDYHVRLKKVIPYYSIKKKDGEELAIDMKHGYMPPEDDPDHPTVVKSGDDGDDSDNLPF